MNKLFTIAILGFLLIFSATALQSTLAKENPPAKPSFFGNLVSTFAALIKPAQNTINQNININPPSPIEKNQLKKQKLYIVDGRIVKIISSWRNATLLSERTGVPLAEIRTAARETNSGIEVPFNKYLSWITRRNNQNAKVLFISTSGERSGKIPVTLGESGNFKIVDSKGGYYYITTVFYQKGTKNEVNRNYWDHKVNNGPLEVEINLEQVSRYINNKIGIYDESLVLPIPEPVEVLNP